MITTVGQVFSFQEITWSGVKKNVKAMVDEMLKEFIGTKEDRLKLVLGDEYEDPCYFTAYLGGYAGGFIGEQVGVAFFTAGLSKAGVISQVLRAGRGAVGTLIGKATAKFPQVVTLAGGTVRSTGVHVQKLSKGFFGEFARRSRGADEVRSARRSASLCRTTTGCLAAGTLVIMADGTCRPIQDVHSGDRVMTIDMQNGGSFSPQLVETQVRSEASRMFRVTWDRDGDQVADGSVAATPEHPFWTEEQGWIRADTVRPGMRLQTGMESQAVVLDAMELLGGAITYNLDVSGPDTFLVGSRGGEAVLVHNLEGDLYPYGFPFREVGESPIYLSNGDGIYTPDFESDGITPKMDTNQQHHFYYDAWIKEHYTVTEFKFGRTAFPSVELSILDHKKVHRAAGDFFEGLQGWNKRRPPTGSEWIKFDGPIMESLAEHMADSIGLEPRKLHTLKNMSQAFLSKCHKKKGCLNP